MIPPPNQLPRVVRSRIENAQEMVQLLAEPHTLPGYRLIKATQRTSVFECVVGGRLVIVKTVQLERWKGLVKMLFKKTRLLRQWRGAELLMDAKIETAEPLLLFRGGRLDLGGVVEALVLEKIEGLTLLRVIADGGLSVREEHALAREVGRLTGRLDRELINNRDHKPSNIIVGRDHAGSWSLAIIDTVGITTMTSKPHRMRQNLAWELLGTGLLPRRALLMRFVDGFLGESFVSEDARARQAQRTALWRQTRQGIESHGDCTPKDDPLAEDEL